jgi:mono/diheme cytochrome c family protein
MLKPCLTFAAVVLFALTLAPATGGMSQAPGGTNPVKPTAASQEKAKALYTRDCAMCHGDNGNGKTDIATSMGVTIEDWTDPKTLASKPDQALFDAIHKGKGEKMPAEEGRAKTDEMWNLVIYIRSLSKNQPAAAQPAPEPAAQAPAASPAPEPSAQPAPQPATPPAAQPTN